MIRHIVLIRFRPEVTEGEVAEIFTALPRLAAKLKIKASFGFELRSIHSAQPISSIKSSKR